MQVVPRGQWVDLSHRLIHHGRRVCLARRPRCEVCTLASICPKVGVSGSSGGKGRHTSAPVVGPERPIRLDRPVRPRVF